MGLTAAQLEARRAYLGGTDMAALAGMSPYARPIDVWREKVGLAEPRPANTMMALGSLLEPVVAGLFSEATGINVVRPRVPARDRRRPWLGGNLDRYTPGGLLECKWAMRADQWGPTQPDPAQPSRVPPGYLVQVQHYLGITGRPVGYLAVLLGYADFRWYALASDPAAIEVLRELGQRFWHENVVPQVPPEPDGSEEYGAWLAQRYRQDDGSEAVATPQQVLWWQDYLEAEAQVGQAMAQRGKAKQRLQDSMGHTAKLLLPEGHITWRSHPKRNIPWKEVAHDLAHRLARGNPDDLLARVAEPYTTTTTERPWRPHHQPQED